MQHTKATKEKSDSVKGMHNVYPNTDKLERSRNLKVQHLQTSFNNIKIYLEENQTTNQNLDKSNFLKIHSLIKFCENIL